MTQHRATVANMARAPKGTVAVSINVPGEEYSATPGDYWDAPLDYCLKDSEGEDMILMSRTTVYRDAVIGELDTYATDQIDRVVADEREGLARHDTPTEDERYQLQIRPNHAHQPTKYMNITPAELAEIRAILARRTL